jgi:hypothetical protein
VVSIEPRRDEEPVAPARFDRLGDRAAVLPVQAVGFPRWKLRSAGSAGVYRDAFHAVGSLALLSNRREGTLEVTINAGPAPGADGVSPWEGMSGAALWVDDGIVGVVSEHHPGDGLARLAAARLDLAFDRADPLRALGELVDIVAAPGERISGAYRAQVADIAPDVLSERDQELAELARFCAGDERSRGRREPRTHPAATGIGGPAGHPGPDRGVRRRAHPAGLGGTGRAEPV